MKLQSGTSKKARHIVAGAMLALAVALAGALAVPTDAQAMTTNKATARPN